MTFEEIRNVAHNHLEAPKNVANKLAEVYFKQAYADKYYNGDVTAIPNRDNVINEITQLVETAYTKLADNLSVAVDNAVYNDLKRKKIIKL